LVGVILFLAERRNWGVEPKLNSNTHGSRATGTQATALASFYPGLEGGRRLRSLVEHSGAIRLADSLVVDGHDEAVARVVTHIHSDHVKELRRSIRELPLIAATPLTLDLLAAMGYSVPTGKRLALPYGRSIVIDGVRLTLLRANHVPGAAEVLVELSDGTRLGYTGDFKLPGTEIMEDLDVLVVDATYGRPEYRRPWQGEIEYLLADIVDEALIHGPVALYGYNGKVEEVMHILRRMQVVAPFIVPRKRFKLVDVLMRHGIDLGEVYPADSREAAEIRKNGWYVEFRHFREWRRAGGPGTHILLTGWEFRAPYRRLGVGNKLVVSFSDHADYEQLMSYIREAKPRLLVVDAARGGEVARFFAKHVSEVLGIRALAMP